MKRPDISIQLYTLREAGGLDRQLDIAAEAGFINVEPYGLQIEEKNFAQHLSQRGLIAPTCHVSSSLLLEMPEKALDAVAEAGVNLAVLAAPHRDNWFAPQLIWEELAAELGKISLLAGERGLRFAYHNHHFELLEVADGRRVIDLLLEQTEGSGLLWEADLNWIERARQSPAEAIQRHASRIVALHVPDTGVDGDFARLPRRTVEGQSNAGWPDILRELEKSALEIVVAEQDDCADPIAFAKASRRRLSEIFEVSK